MITYILFILGFVVLIYGAHLLVDGSASFAHKLRVSNIVIGLTVVAFGTSMPEFVVNIFASIKGDSDLVIGNILGSNIANIFLILGISALVYPITAKKNTILKEIPLSLLAAMVLGFLANDMLIDGNNISSITRIDGFILLSFFIIFLYYVFAITKKDKDIVEKEDIKIYNYKKSFLFILSGLIFLILGGKWIVEGAMIIATNLNINQSIIGLTIVAVGTSLPELVTSVVASYKRHSDIAIGNVVGSNIFNIFWILGASAIINPLYFDVKLNKDIAMTILASLILFIMMFIGKKNIIERWQGLLMVLIYISYILFLIF